MHHHYWRSPNRNVQTFVFVYHDTKWPKSWSSVEDPVVSSWAESVRSCFSRTLVGKAIRESSKRKSWEEVSNWNAYSSTARRDYSYRCMWMTSNWLERNKTLIRLGMSKEQRKIIILVCVRCKTSNDIVDNYRYLFELRMLVGEVEKLSYSKESEANDSSWNNDMECQAKKCVERYCELAAKTSQQFFQVATPCFNDHQFKKEDLGCVGDRSKVCSQIVLKCSYLVRIGRLDVLWSVNKLACAITKRTRACDKQWARFVSFIT